MTSRIIARRALLQGAGGLGLAGTFAGRAGAQGKEPLKLGITEPLTGSAGLATLVCGNDAHGGKGCE